MHVFRNSRRILAISRRILMNSQRLLGRLWVYISFLLFLFRSKLVKIKIESYENRNRNIRVLYPILTIQICVNIKL